MLAASFNYRANIALSRTHALVYACGHECFCNFLFAVDDAACNLTTVSFYSASAVRSIDSYSHRHFINSQAINFQCSRRFPLHCVPVTPCNHTNIIIPTNYLYRLPLMFTPKVIIFSSYDSTLSNFTACISYVFYPCLFVPKEATKTITDIVQCHLLIYYPKAH